MSDFRLPRLRDGVQLISKEGTPTVLFIRWWQSMAEQIEVAFTGLADAVAAIAAAQAAADAANAAADAAQTAADAADAAAAAAQVAADDATVAAGDATVAAEDAAAVAALTNSGVSGATITATDAGTNVTVSITAHTRLYGNGASVSVNAGSVTALAYSTEYWIYYDQASRLGGTVTYAATTTKLTAAQTGDRHLVGTVTTPAALGAPIDGFYVDLSGLGSIFY